MCSTSFHNFVLQRERYLIKGMAKNKVELEACEIEFLDNGIVHTHFKDGKLVQEEDVQAMFGEIRSILDGQKCLLLVSTGTDATLTNEARALASSATSNDIIAADAIVVRDFYHQLTANTSESTIVVW